MPPSFRRRSESRGGELGISAVFAANLPYLAAHRGKNGRNSHRIAAKNGKFAAGWGQKVCDCCRVWWLTDESVGQSVV